MIFQPSIVSVPRSRDLCILVLNLSDTYFNKPVRDDGALIIATVVEVEQNAVKGLRVGRWRSFCDSNDEVGKRNSGQKERKPRRLVHVLYSTVQ
jgi:hypothetical protein